MDFYHYIFSCYESPPRGDISRDETEPPGHLSEARHIALPLPGMNSSFILTKRSVRASTLVTSDSTKTPNQHPKASRHPAHIRPACPLHRSPLNLSKGERPLWPRLANVVWWIFSRAPGATSLTPPDSEHGRRHFHPMRQNREPVSALKRRAKGLGRPVFSGPGYDSRDIGDRTSRAVSHIGGNDPIPPDSRSRHRSLGLSWSATLRSTGRDAKPR